MFVEHRTYTFRPGTLAPWLRKYEGEGLDIQKRHLGTFLGLFTTEFGNTHQVVILWGWESLDDRDRRRAAMNADPDWQAYIGAIWEMNAIETQEVKILRPTASSPPLG
ncbi:MAG: NIPSNAP family protein [Bauldia sp.]|nr:NIPSNAP family protein [Bauldia sp.]